MLQSLLDMKGKRYKSKSTGVNLEGFCLLTALETNGVQL